MDNAVRGGTISIDVLGDKANHANFDRIRSGAAVFDTLKKVR